MTNILQAKQEVFADSEALAAAVADWLIERTATSEGVFAVALSGGSTPRRLYELLTAGARREKFPWSRAHWFWGDERFVRRDDARSNYRMAWEAMLRHAPVPPDQIHAFPVEANDPEAAALIYERELQSFYGEAALDPRRPVFEITLLGLGTDGHTASLFPGAAALDERRRWVASVQGVMPEPRLTLTYPVLESSRHVAFLVAGSEKRAALARFRRGDQELPAARLRPTGELWLFADAAAAEGGP
jgi:6-phosphogluconolactonase